MKAKRKQIFCDSCEMCSINGVACHETGCPNSRKTWDAEREVRTEAETLGRPSVCWYEARTEEVGCSNRCWKARGRMQQETILEYMERRDRVAVSLISEYTENLPNAAYRQSWEVIPAARLRRLWKDYTKFGFVRDERGMEMLTRIVIQNICKLDVNTILTGHTPESPALFAESITDEKYAEDYFDKEDFFSDENGAWRISDYAMTSLQDAAFDLIAADSAEGKLQVIDHILNIVHQRSDLASWFVEGGSKTLTALANS